MQACFLFMLFRVLKLLLRKLLPEKCPPPAISLVAFLWVGSLGLGTFCTPILAGGTVQELAYPAGLRVFDLDGRSVNPFGEMQTKATVFIFVSVDCPISNSYMPEYRRLKEEFSRKGIAIKLIYADPEELPEAIRTQLKDYQCPVQALRDPRHELVKTAEVRVTPEAAVFIPEHGLVYHGRIDDRYVELGRARPAALTHDLREVLKDILDGRFHQLRTTHAVGCYIPGVP